VIEDPILIFLLTYMTNKNTCDKITVFILGHYRQGAADGLAEFNYRITQLLKDEFTIEFVEFSDEKSLEWYSVEQVDGIRIHNFGAKNRAKFKLPTLFNNWITTLHKKRNIFHLSHIYNIDNYLVAKLLTRFNIPFLITPHDTFVYHPSYKLSKPLLKRWYRSLFVNIFDKYVLDKAAVVHGITQMCSVYLQHITKASVSVVTNQVHDMNIPFDETLIKQQVCFIGRFNIFGKGIDLALTAFQLFKTKFDKKDEVIYTLIGPADEQVIKERDQICSKLGLQIGKDVFFTGKITEAERNSILGQSKVYMQLSRSEGFGLSIAQALSCYKPVIISSHVPIHDKITAHQAGFVVNNPEEAAQALAVIFALTPSEYLSMAMNARHCYEQEFHPDVIKPQLIQLYEKTALSLNNI
jgi:glycosyltransferase involved in cell wall biosynthesis